MHKIIAAIMLTTILGPLSPLTLASSEPASPLQSVQYVDLGRYVGIWYDIAHYPSKYQERCEDSTTSFSLRNNGEIDVLNSCRDNQDGTLRHATGHGRVIDMASNARLKISYFWPFRKEYVIIDQGKEYEYSVICTADKKNLWIIARSPSMSNEVFEKISTHLEQQGFHRGNIIKTVHSKNLQPVQLNTPKAEEVPSVSVK
jgi:apolipoprotein D and lipocalin family protein